MAAKMDDLSIAAVKTALQDFQPFSKNGPHHLPLPPVTPPKKPKKPILEKELNTVLVKVQDDIQQIKQNVLSKLANGQTVDPEKIKALFEQAEQDIEERKIHIVNQFNCKPMIASVTNIHKNKSAGRNRYDNDEKPTTVISKTRKGSANQPSPGQKAIALMKLKSIINPARADGRSLLNKHYGVPLPKEKNLEASFAVKRSEEPRPTPVVGTTTNHFSPVPKANRINSRLTPPPPTAEDKRKGVMSLIERKIIPASSHLSVSLSPVKNKAAVLHKPLDIKQYKQQLAMVKPEYNLALVKFDETSLHGAIDLTCKRSKLDTGDSFVASGKIVQESSLAIQDSTTISEDQPLESMHQSSTGTQLSRKIMGGIPPLPSEMSHQRSSHKFAIQNGRTHTAAHDFMLFKQHYCLSWGGISSLLQRVEKLMVDYSIPIAFVDGDRLADLSLFFEVGPKPTIKDLLMCIANKDEVEKLIVIPGRRYKAPDGMERAAIKIQSTWKCHVRHSAYLEYRRKKWAAGMIALTWIMKCKMTMIREEIKENDRFFLQQYRKRSKLLQQNWSKIRSAKRLILHVPSLGYSTVVREKLENIGLLENSQIGRICDLIDPNVEVVYISPVKLTDDLKHYYDKLIEVMADIHNIDAEHAKSRLRILTPDHYDRFPAHNLCLSSLFRYSVSLVQRVKSIVKGKTAYMVPGMMSKDDLYLSQQFDIPILGCEPSVAQLYSLKSGVCRIFESAGVNTPPNAYDLYSPEQIYESLATLVTENLDITRWLFKIDNQFNGRGTAYCDVVPHLSSYESARRERAKYGDDKWKKKWANESKYNVILAEIPRILEQNHVILDGHLYPTWLDFLTDFCRYGGTVEGVPPSESVTGITANVLIEPDGEVNILAIADQIHATSPYRCWGYTLPQSSIEPNVVNKSIVAISEACKLRGISGYISVDFVTFIDPETDAQKLWAVGLNIAYSSSYAMTRLMEFLTGGSYDHRENKLVVTINKQLHMNVAYRSKRKKLRPSQEKIIERQLRYCVMSANLFHTNLNNVHSSVFFQLCRAHGIGYDDKMKVGTSFTLLDHIRRERMGMLFLGESLYDAVWNCTCNLQIIHHDISSPTMQGKSNFHGAIEDMKAILRSLQVNHEINQSLYPTLDPMRRIGSVGSAQNAILPLTSENNTDSGNRKSIITSKYGITTTTTATTDNESDGATPLLALSSSTGLNCIDNRFPSSPVSNNESGL